ncbi:MAG: ABC transporter substrate-binding protein [Alphaproteobacteria bacterium]|nr:ABC transporter substrate-binding protein [Alphaproteobacteria bacterium]MBM3651164.1 ABC transporter substrate-binding protein [Alphaproteobacteria bacterium]
MRNLIRPLAAALLLSSSLAAPSLAQDNNVIRYVPQGDLRVLDPIWTTGTVTQVFGMMIYDTLFAHDGKLQVQPQMVESWSVTPDNLVYRFTLRSGLAFHDGSPVTSKDVIPSLQRWGKRDIMGQRLFQSIAKLDAVDDRTFTITMKEPYGLVIKSIGRVGGLAPVIMTAKMAATDAGTQVPEHIGSGPFTYDPKEWVPGSKIVLRKNPKYVSRSEPSSWAAGEKKVMVDRVEWTYIPDPATIAAALNAGEIDLWETPINDMIPGLKRNPNVTIQRGDPLGNVGTLRPNHLHPPFNDVRARQALGYLMEQEDYLRASVSSDPNDWRVCWSLFVCGSGNDTTKGTEAYTAGTRAERDAKAKKLFEEAGYKGEPIVILQATDFPTFSAAALVMADSLKRIGVKVDLQATDWNSVLTRRAVKAAPAQGGWNIFFTSGAGVSGGDPFTNPASTACDKAWFGWPCHAGIEKLRDAWTREVDPKKQREVLDELHAQLMEQGIWYTYGQWFTQTAFRSNLKGIQASPVRYFWNVTKG